MRDEQFTVLKNLTIAALVTGTLSTGALAQSVRVPAESVQPSHGLRPISTSTEVGLDVSLAWDSHYVLEGRDSLNGDSLGGMTADLVYKGLTVGAWYGASPDTDYTELNGYVIYTIEHGNWEFSASYNHLEFLADDTNDDEVGAAVAYNGIPGGWVAHVDWYHSLEAEGSFFEAVLGTEYAIGESLTIAPAVAMGFNAGYVPDGHNGLNSVATSIEAALAFRENVNIVGYLAYTWAVDADPERHPDDELLEDFGFAGVALNCSL